MSLIDVEIEIESGNEKREDQETKKEKERREHAGLQARKHWQARCLGNVAHESGRNTVLCVRKWERKQNTRKNETRTKPPNLKLQT